MKTILLTLALCLAGLSAIHAQTEKGRWMIGTSFGGFTYQDNSTSKTFLVSISPSAGYFIANNLLVGTGIPLSLTTQDPGSDNPYMLKSVTTSFGLSPFIRYYIGKSALKPYVGLAYSHLFNNYKVTPSTNSSFSVSGYSNTISPGVGLAYFFNQTIAVNAGLNYNIIKGKQGYYTFTTPSVPQLITLDSDIKSLTLSIGLQIFIGK